MKNERYKVSNRLQQTLTLDDGTNIWPYTFVILDKVTFQVKQLESRGFVTVRKVNSGF